jgi:hypothetical protein
MILMIDANDFGTTCIQFSPQSSIPPSSQIRSTLSPIALTATFMAPRNIRKTALTERQVDILEDRLDDFNDAAGGRTKKETTARRQEIREEVTTALWKINPGESNRTKDELEKVRNLHRRDSHLLNERTCSVSAHGLTITKSSKLRRKRQGVYGRDVIYLRKMRTGRKEYVTKLKRSPSTHLERGNFWAHFSQC